MAVPIDCQQHLLHRIKESQRGKKKDGVTPHDSDFPFFIPWSVAPRIVLVLIVVIYFELDDEMG